MGHPTATRWGVARELGYLLMTDEGDFWSQSPESSSPHMGPLQALSSGDVFLVNACGSGLHVIAGLASPRSSVSFMSSTALAHPVDGHSKYLVVVWLRSTSVLALSPFLLGLLS
jgi:hypothetical protein